jgi:hypothetical protein
MTGYAMRAALGVAALLLAAESAHAFRCGSRIITPGDHAEKLLKFCGEPTSVVTRLSQRGYQGSFGRVYPGLVEEVLIEEWTYNLGPRQLMRVVRLENGLVADIKHLGYGY